MTGPGGKPTGTLARRGRELPKRLFRRWLWSVGYVLEVFETGYRGDRGPVIYGPAGISAAAM
jgi:hypothetical protein